jgi:hypothetical protein
MLHEKTYDEMPERIVADMPEKKVRALMAKAHEKKISTWRQDIKKKSPATPRRPYEESALAGD